MIRILCFAEIGEKLGNSISITAVENMTVSALRRELGRQYPECRELIETCMIAVNQEYAREETIIGTKDEVALIPPISGG
ncbi:MULTISPECIES: molybdopterin converting factor subunit 1 [Thermoactinomyces]|jgi:MoaE-MoaD fusion protein|uniref:Molybdopterin synthase sulfur carrier subunit n=1 Tax=Thermoactinomyces daqus TaxID=1329516 RepID=A0A7W1XBS9_9BACL|nr:MULTISPECIES: molybdopterin converting factor subunit 1 [Thermoactinomyces]MBA4543790.1 molybdopterin converting factor subunit 1 [Thermoactinomyces daqus]MBH8598413.1 molybdopterin converting factor subunit 1 [Thermoactinomyces sp. CICC 10523]MBH8604538.1 molybdopterin converting factor subunit 1 [Thermoactinomyces sp. CICC 10522]MBH8607459.1 molybdopterin converting factor subunit 1 [Thermoactinomyces sp. CICC 10521]